MQLSHKYAYVGKKITEIYDWTYVSCSLDAKSNPKGGRSEMWGGGFWDPAGLVSVKWDDTFHHLLYSSGALAN